MKKLLLLLLIIPILTIAQTQTDTSGSTMVSQDVRACIQKIHNDPDAIKELMTMMMRDKENMRRIHRELMNDPDMKQMMQEMRKEMQDNRMHDDMNNKNNMEHRKMDRNKNNESGGTTDTTRIK